MASGWGRAPWGLLGMLALVAAVELFWVRDNLGITSDQALSWKYAGRRAERRARGCGVLCCGDSLVKMGVMPRILGRELGCRAFNLALYNGPAPASYFLLRRAVRAGARPSAVVVDFVAGILAEGPRSKARPYDWPDLLSPGEALDLAWSARDADLFARVLVGEVFPSVRRRFEVRGLLMAALEGRDLGHKRHARYLLWNWDTNDGAHLNLPRQAPELAAPPGGPPQPGTWRCDPVNERYHRRFLDLAAAHRIAVYWLLPPLHPTWQASMEYQGEDARFTAFVRALRDRYPDVVVVDGRHSGFERTAFVDPVHLNPAGATACTTALAEVIARHAHGGSVAPRWVKLPDYRTTLARSVENGSGVSRKSLEPSIRVRRR
ncbi:MAG: hypothetical protein JO252_10215 [Planctomycetaceae bacterium]|nr:hypothetical protein [Planctomycetaceae bacterium]